ncbi:MAG TPA: CheR family methyltransferase [Thermoanaerobaculia bacterium]|nr:CheR family methyltransferase [Thermoanaerobaculia bacterium]
MSGDPKPREGKAVESPASDFVKLLDYLKSTRGFDFSGYKLSSLIRRVQKRMQQVGVASYSDYIDYLEVHPDEFFPLFNTILINVTSFFRDPQAWAVVREQILPRILESKAPEEPIRCWSAGCASGEEAYTLAILLAEALGDAEYRRRVKIYGTDADDEALAQARLGIYTPAQAEAVPEELRSRYFERHGERYAFRPDLRRSLIFGRHDLVQDAAISRVDLLTCRNALMYFNSETQAKILARFHFALNRNGYLFLGKAETLLTHGNSFRPEDLKTRIFQRTGNASLRDRLLALTPAASGGDVQGGLRTLRVREAAFDSGPVAQIAVDRRGSLVLANDKARRMFSLSTADLGRPLQDLEISYRPVELRSHIESVGTSRTGVTLNDVEWRPVGSDPRVLEVHVLPLMDGGGTVLGTGVSFVDNTLPNRLHSELERANQELETAYEELQSANEELETTNEELQSTIEELETTNEELQSANEELETMNEELQSTNEELRAMNDQIQVRSEELRNVNSYLHTILASLRAAVVVLNPNLEVEIWSEKAQELWGLRQEEIQGQPFLSLDIGLPVKALREPILQGLNDGPRGIEMELDGVNRRGRPIRCKITCTRVDDGQGSLGAILLIEEVSHDRGELPPN